MISAIRRVLCALHVRLHRNMQPAIVFKNFAGWTSHIYNPWLSKSRLLRSAHAAAEAFDAFSHRGDRTEMIRLNSEASSNGETKVRVFAGPWCRVLTDEVNRSERSDFWDLVRATPLIEWLLLFDGGTKRSVKLPPDWGDGFANCRVGVKLDGPARASEQLDALRSIPSLHRFGLSAPLLEDLGDLNLHGLDWFIAQLSDERLVDSEAVTALRLQCMAFGIPFWLEEVGRVAGTTQGLDRYSFRDLPAS